MQLVDDQEDMSRRAAARVLEALRRRPDLLLGAVTGDSPLRTYELLAARPSLFRRARVTALDEWRGLPRGHPATCEAYVRKRIVGPLAIGRSRWQAWRSDARDPLAECRRMSRWLDREGPIDLCLLGLGRNGHLLMNEPGPSFPPGLRAARLLPSTRRHPMVRALKPRPRFGFTLGLADILRSRAIVLLVSGAHKAAPLKRMLAGRVTTRCPASFLWLHPDVTVYCDRAAAGKRTR